ncbi:MAG: TPM domain-containing protein [Holophagae bacterium]|jgi:uncharacterized protein
MRRRVFLAYVMVVLATLPAAALDVPRLEARVTDLAGLYTSTEAAGIERALEVLENETGAQVAVLTIPGLDGVPIEDVSIRVVDTWQLGEAERDNGVLILIARDDRRIRIEVGYGLEGLVPDALAGRIIDQAMTPAFRQGDFAGGTLNAIDVIGAAIRGDPDLGARLPAGRPSSDTVVPGLAAAVIFLAVIGTFAMSALFSKGGAGWFLYLFLTPFFFAFPGAMLGPRWGAALAAAWLVGYPILRVLIWHTDAGKRLRTSSSRGGGMWFPVGGSWSGGGFGGGGFGGGFSGGGGGFGGGGASGGW